MSGFTAVAPRDTATPRPAARASATGQRADIQGLRALAVVAVFAYHLWPDRVTGGYVGVDVFFVISGFLITSHLLRRPVRGGRDLLTFWARRVRRLIPAATVVLLATLAASALWLPATVRASVAREVTASALYVENWALARTATDYLAADQLHTPVQHYWSLSVEEQFYVVWPLVVGVLVWLAARRRWAASATVVGIAVVVAASLAWSVHLTTTDPARAYFVSTTRIWELAAGGLLAAVVARGGLRAGSGLLAPTAVRALLAWSGLVLIVVAVLTFDAETGFPGYAAVLPVVGTLLVIVAASDGVRGGPDRVLGARPVAWTGDVSYSLYLWHWPLIVVAPFALGRSLAWWEQLAVVGAAVVLAGLSKRYVEDPARRSETLGRTLRATFAVLAACVLVVVLAAQAMALRAQADERAADAAMQAALADPPDCFGAEAARDAGCEFPGEELITPPLSAQEDKPDVYADGCWNNTPFDSRRTCTYGEQDDPALRVALVGNSHAGHWQPPLAEVVEERDGALTTYLVSECYTVDVPVDMGTEEATENCLAWNEWVTAEVARSYDLVVMSNRTFREIVDVDESEQGDVAKEAYARVLERITGEDTPVLVLRDTPGAPSSVPDCVSAHEYDPSDCAVPRDDAVERDPLAEAAADDTSGLVDVADVNDLLCDDEECHPVVGGVVAFFDHGHLSRTFAETLAPEVEEAVEEALGPDPH